MALGDSRVQSAAAGRGIHVATPAKQAKRLGGIGMGMFTPSSRPTTPGPERDGERERSTTPTPGPTRIRASVTPDVKSRILKTKLSNSQLSISSSAPNYASENVPPVPSIPFRHSQIPALTSSIRLVPSSSSTDLLRISQNRVVSANEVGEVSAQLYHQEEDVLGPSGYDMEALPNVGLGMSKRIGGDNENVLVTIRVRPPNTSLSSTEDNAWTHPTPSTLSLSQPTPKHYTFDRVLPPATTNADIYSSSCRPHVLASLKGYNSVIFAYGQTASGKTWTLSGGEGDKGVIGRGVAEVFAFVRGREGRGREWVLRASYLELYNETLVDLLLPAPPPNRAGQAGPPAETITILGGKRPNEVELSGLTEMVVTHEGEVEEVLRIGEKRRRVGGTDWNERSSRSHSVFRMVIESRLKSENEDHTGMKTPGGRSRNDTKATRISCLSMIDLAGSEKATGSKERNAEGKYINQSLLTLKNVISKLAEQSARKTSGHIPYRDSKLTRLLQPSLSGDARISVICTINPNPSAITESQSTLLFAAGVKRVTLNAQKMEVVDPAALIQQYQNEIAELKAKLAMREAGSGLERRMTVTERQERDNFHTRLQELKRLILTSAEEDDDDEQQVKPPASPSKIDHGKSNYALQEELHIAAAKIKVQAAELERLRVELALRPKDPDRRCRELQMEVNRLTEMTKEYEANLLNPSQKVREDVEAEWIPKVQALEARAKEKEHFYKELYDDVHNLKVENIKLKEKCVRLEAEKQNVFHLLQSLEENGPSASTNKAASPSHRRAMSEVDHQSALARSTGSSKPKPIRDPSFTSGKLAAYNRMTDGGVAAMMRGDGWRDDSEYDLAARVAFVPSGDEDDDEVF